MALIRKNETQLKYLYGEETVEIMKNAIKEKIKTGIPTMSVDKLESMDDETLEKKLKKL